MVEAAYYKRQAAFCEDQLTALAKRRDDLDAEAESYYKLERETRAAIKTLEDAAAPAVVFDYAKPVFKYDFKVGDRVKRVSAIGYRYAVNVEDTTGTVLEAYTGNDDYYALNVKWDVEHFELRRSHVQNVQPAFEYDFKVGDRVKHSNNYCGHGTVIAAYTGDEPYHAVKVLPDKSPSDVHTWSAYNLTKIT